MNHIIEALEPVTTPLIVLALGAVGGWGMWVSIASYDATQHLEDYENTTTELREAVDDLNEVKVGLAEQRVVTDQTLNEILRTVRAL